MSQGSRDGVMISFKSGRLPILVATDVAARGLDIAVGHPHRQLRRADLARRLRAPHRPHRPRRALGPRDHVRRAAPAARPRGDRAPRRHHDRAVGRGRARRPGATSRSRPRRHRKPHDADGAQRRGLHEADRLRRPRRRARRGRPDPRGHRRRRASTARPCATCACSSASRCSRCPAGEAERVVERRRRHRRARPHAALEAGSRLTLRVAACPQMTMTTNHGDDRPRAVRRRRAEDRRQLPQARRGRLLRRADLPPRDPGLHDPGRLPGGHRHRRPRLHVRGRVQRPQGRRAARSRWRTPARTPTARSSSSSPRESAPWLDGKHTVFGEVTDGHGRRRHDLRAPRDGRDRPQQEARIERLAISG